MFGCLDFPNRPKTQYPCILAFLGSPIKGGPINVDDCLFSRALVFKLFVVRFVSNNEYDDSDLYGFWSMRDFDGDDMMRTGHFCLGGDTSEFSSS